MAFVSVVLCLTTRKHIFIYQKLFKDKKELLFSFQFYKFIGKPSNIRSLLLNWKGSDSSFYDVTHHKDDFSNKNQILFQFVFRVNTAFDIDRYLFGVLSTCEDVRENFQEIWPKLDRLCQIWHIGRFGLMLFRAPES